MFGATIGSFNIFFGSERIFTLTGDQGDQWLNASITTPAILGQVLKTCSNLN